MLIVSNQNEASHYLQPHIIGHGGRSEGFDGGEFGFSGSGMWVGLEFGIERLKLQLQRKELSLRVGEIRFNVEGG